MEQRSRWQQRGRSGKGALTLQPEVAAALTLQPEKATQLAAIVAAEATREAAQEAVTQWASQMLPATQLTSHHRRQEEAATESGNGT